MIPPLIVDEALRKGLDVIAVTDHNTTGNAAAVMGAAKGSTLTVLPGMELQTREEVELLCIFGSVRQADAWQAKVDDWLPPLENDADRFGPQFVVDAEGDFVREETRLLQAPASVGLEEAAQAARSLGGLVIPAHIDRPAKGLIPVLGFWPPELGADAAEVSYNMRPSQARETYRSVPDIPLISGSDGHWLDWIGKVITVFELIDSPSIAELRRAFKGLEGRRVYVP
jgi:hypothetical protein